MASKKCTIFCDIDGTLFEYRKFATYKTTNPVIITTTVTSINNAYDEGHCVILTTARPEYLRAHTVKELDNADVKYHRLLLGIERGSRILINDNETETVNRAFAFNVERNKGFTTTQSLEFSEILKK